MLDCVEREPLLHAASPRGSRRVGLPARLRAKGDRRCTRPPPAGAGGLACPLGCAQRGPPVHAASPCGSRWVGLPAWLRAKGIAGARGLPLREQAGWPVCLTAWKWNPCCTRPPPAGAGGLACLLDCMQRDPHRTWPPLPAADYAHGSSLLGRGRWGTRPCCLCGSLCAWETACPPGCGPRAPVVPGCPVCSSRCIPRLVCVARFVALALGRKMCLPSVDGPLCGWPDAVRVAACPARCAGYCRPMAACRTARLPHPARGAPRKVWRELA